MDQEQLDYLREMIIEGEKVIPKKTFKKEKELSEEEPKELSEEEQILIEVLIEIINIECREENHNLFGKYRMDILCYLQKKKVGFNHISDLFSHYQRKKGEFPDIDAFEEELKQELKYLEDNGFSSLFEELQDFLDLFQKAYKIEYFEKIRRISEKNFTSLKPWNLYLEDLRILSKLKTFDDISDICSYVKCVIRECMSEGVTCYLVKTKGVIETIVYDKTVMDKVRNMVIFNPSDISKTDIIFSYETFDDKGKRKQKDISLKYCLDKYVIFDETLELIYRNPSEYFSGEKPKKGSINVFTGFKAKYTKGYDIKKIKHTLHHLKNILCNAKDDDNKKDINHEDLKDYRYLIQWLSNICKGKKTRSCIIFYSAFGGTGKSFFQEFFGKKVIGQQSYLFLDTQSTICGNFNSHIAGKTFICIDELKKPTENDLQTMKSYVTASDIVMTQKYQDTKSKSSSNYMNIMINTNDANYLFLLDQVDLDTGDSKNRRFYIIETNDSERNNMEFIKKLETEFNDPEWGNTLYSYLIDQYDESYNLNEPAKFKTRGSKTTKQQNDNILPFLLEMSNNGLENCYNQMLKGSSFVKSSEIFEVYKKQYCSSTRMALNTFGKHLYSLSKDDKDDNSDEDKILIRKSVCNSWRYKFSSKYNLKIDKEDY